MCNRARLRSEPETLHTRFGSSWAADAALPNRDPVELTPRGRGSGGSVIADWRMAEALAIQKLHGVQAAAWMAGRLRALAAAGDEAGVERFRAIAAKLVDLLVQAGRPC